MGKYLLGVESAVSESFDIGMEVDAGGFGCEVSEHRGNDLKLNTFREHDTRKSVTKGMQTLG
jgi:hypothetical protein